MTRYENTQNSGGKKTPHSRILFNMKALEAVLVAILIFCLSKISQDYIMHPRSYGHGRVLYPALTAFLSAIFYFYCRKSQRSIYAMFFLGIALVWLSSTVAAIVDSALSTDFLYQITSNMRNLLGVIVSVIFGPFIVATPIIGGVVFATVYLASRKMFTLNSK